MSLAVEHLKTTQKSRRLSRWNAPIPYAAVGPLLFLLDFLVILLLSVLSGAAYHFVALDDFGEFSIFLGVGCAIGVLFAGSMQARGAYSPSNFVISRGNIRRVAVTWLCVFAFLVATAFLLKLSQHLSRGYFVSLFCAGLLVLPLTRVSASRTLRIAMGAGLVHGQRVLLIGQPEELAEPGLVDNLRLFGFEVWHTLTMAPDPGFHEDVPRLVAEIVEGVREHRLDQILIAASWARLSQSEELARALHVVHQPVRLLPDRQVRRVLERQSMTAGLGFTLELKRSPLTTAEQAVKRAFDLLVASVVIILLAPLFLVVALAIRLDSSGPSLFRQQRVGFSGRVFRIYKFRTMVALEDGPVIRQATVDDARVTRVGRWLRRTSIDELPQLFNVLTGEMSLVGPRPHATAHDSEYDSLISNYALRQHVKPGITGLAQVSGFRGETSTLDRMEGRIEQDLRYINNWSPALDFRVLVATLREVLRSRTAY